MTKSKRAALATLFNALARKCESMREWDEMLREIERMERDHRRSRSGYATPVSVAVQYFACRCVLNVMALPTTWAGLSAIRPDYVLGQTIRESRGSAALLDLEQEWNGMTTGPDRIEYSADIVGK